MIAVTCVGAHRYTSLSRGGQRRTRGELRLLEQGHFFNPAGEVVAAVVQEGIVKYFPGSADQRRGAVV